MTQNKQEETNAFSWTQMLILFLLIIFIIIAYFDKQKEKKALEKIKKDLMNRKEITEQLRRDAEKKFRYIYIAFKVFIVIAFFTICYFLHSIAHENFVQYIDTCITFFGGLGILLLVGCFVIEENPIGLFRLRSIMKAKIFNIIFSPIQSQIDELPQIEQSIIITNFLINDLDKN